MADIRISQLPTAPNPISGTELVPVVQNGLTVQTTVSAITSSPNLNYTFLTVGQQTNLPSSRYFSTGTGLGITDGGALGAYTIALNGTSGSLETASTGVIVKSAPNTISARTLSTSGNGVSVTNGDGVSGNPTFQLTGLAAALANMSGTGLIGLNSTTLTPLTLIGDSNEITIANGNGASGNPTIGIADNAVFPGTAGVTVPNGTTAERGATQGQIRYNTTNNRFEGNYSTGWQTFGTGDGAITSVAGTTNQIVVSTVGGAATVSIDPDPVIPGVGAIQIPSGATGDRPGGVNGQLRYNTSTALFEGYANGAWGSIVTGTGVTSVATGTGLTGGPITSTGTISIANTGAVAGSYGTAARTVTQLVNAQGQITSISDQPIDGIALTTGSISTTPSTANDLVNKSYVDGLVSTGLVYHQPVQAATTGTLASITGGTVTYNNGTAGVGATLTLSVALTTLDGYTLLNTNRILVKDEANQAHNGIYTWATGGTVLTRATDADTYGTSPNQLSQNDYFFVQNGTVNKGIAYVVTTVGTITFGTTAITFAEFSTSQVYTAGTGLTLTGTQFSLTTPVTAALGGTGQSSYTTGDLIYASGTTALSKLAAGTNGYLLTMNAGLPSWQPAPASGVTSISFDTTGLTPATSTTGAVTVGGTLVAANGGTGQSSYTTGDLLYASGSAAISKLGVGTNGYILTVSGGLPSWQPAPATGVTSFQTSLSGLTPSTSTTGAVTLAGTLGVGSGGTGLTSVTANHLPYGNGTSALQTSANLTFDGTTLTAATGANFATTSGAVGIATSSPSALLHLGTLTAKIRIGIDGGSQYADIYRDNATGYTVYNAAQADPFRAHVWQLGGTEAMRIATSGNVGIGSTSPTWSLVVQKNQNASTVAQVLNTDTGVNAAAVFQLQSGATAYVNHSAVAAGSYYAVQGAGGITTWYADFDTKIFRTTAGVENFRITSSGNVGIGTASPAVKLAISSTDAILVPVGTTAERPTGATGYIRYNTTTGGFEGYSGSSWGSLGGGNTTTYGLWENNATISANYTITAGNNAMSAGPIVINSGVVVTVPSGSTWTIV